MAGNPHQHDLSSLQHFLDLHSAATDPVVVQPGDTDTAGMSFQELFSHYLAPEVAKLPPSSAPPAADSLPFSFGASTSSSDASGSAPFSPASNATFDPSTFMPTLPGSPIGAFSPSSDGNSTGRSPMSFPDLDFSATSSDPFAIDPSIFTAPTSLAGFATTSAPEQSTSSSASYTPPTSVGGSDVSPAPFALANAPLPPLPSLPTAPAELAYAPVPDLAVPVETYTASGRPKRNVAQTVIPEEDEDDLYSSDGSHVTTTTRKSSRKPSAAKKARSSSASGESAAAAAARLAKTSVQPLASSTLHKTTPNSALPPVPQWADKPDPAEYAKLSSKEKRQLRNKLSARNFRHRRKEYITTLEDEISSRDTIIAELRDEMGVVRAENTDLRTEVTTLKEKWQDLLDKLSSLSGPPAAAAPATAAAGLGTNPSRAVAASSGSAPVTVKEEEGLDAPSLATPAASTSSRRIGTRSGGVARPNLSKDVAPSSLARRNTGSWATAGGAGGGFMSVHTTFTPDINLADGLHAKPALAAASPFSTQSFNPALNTLSANQLADLPALTSHLRAGFSPSAGAAGAQQPQQPKGTFEDFFASNPYWLRPDQLDQNRAALYGKLANNAAGLVAAQKQQQPSPAPGSPDQSQSSSSAYLPVPAGFRPAFFRASSLPKVPAASGAAEAGPSSPLLPVSHQDATLQREQDALAARVAHLATQTLSSRMWGAFVDAFAGAGEGTGKGKARELSGEKVAAVLGGRARVQVVPVAPQQLREGSDAVDSLGAQLGGMSLRPSSPALSSSGGGGEEDRAPCAYDGVCARWLTGSSAPTKRA
ncbi:hypothetical protein Rhopal_004080-T1 [Rhodotorula paludigena]|uniref:BZIP domain-containing protein n=1 Tax=Rhodotorula paludigena TaxID=86838 RepID=A0AAV5GNG9_9BASI|nr:hypothetical protein Rhopal_004080-T1 [Rhodotorula paludigena]